LDGFLRKEGGSKQIAAIYCYLEAYIILPPPLLLLVSAWVLASYLTELWDRFPHLGVESPVGRCGKSRLLELLEKVCLNAWPVLNPSAAVLYRKIADKKKPTVLFDEAQALDRGDKNETCKIVYDMFCAAISKNASVPRCEHDGEEWVVVDFPVYCPKVMARIGRIKGILADRCLRITIKRKHKDEKTERSRERVWGPKGEKLGKALAKWAKDSKRKKRITEVYDRLDLFAMDNERMAEMLLPLQAVVIEEFGEDSLPYRALRHYALGSEALDREAEKDSAGLLLLRAIREIFAEKDGDFLPTPDLIQALCRRDEEPWYEYTHGKPINDVRIAGLLADYEIKSGRNKDRTARGYYKADFRDAWERYLTPPLLSRKPVQPGQPVQKGAVNHAEAQLQPDAPGRSAASRARTLDFAHPQR
jgi:hypothetical protein